VRHRRSWGAKFPERNHRDGKGPPLPEPVGSSLRPEEDMWDIGGFPKTPSWGPTLAPPQPEFRAHPPQNPRTHLPLASAMASPKLPDGAEFPCRTDLLSGPAWSVLPPRPHPTTCPLPRLTIKGAILG